MKEIARTTSSLILAICTILPGVAHLTLLEAIGVVDKRPKDIRHFSVRYSENHTLQDKYRVTNHTNTVRPSRVVMQTIKCFKSIKVLATEVQHAN
jgi:hypothetical protein